MTGVVGLNTGESTITELADGSLLINMRNHPRLTGRRTISLSKDSGLTWSRPKLDMALTDPGCQGSLLRFTLKARTDKNRLLFSNPASRKREKMTVRLSYDEGESWPVSRQLHAGPSAYSCLAVLPDQSICCLYERGKKHPYETITFARFSLRWLSGGADSLKK
jgi:sialidase-1